MADMHEKEYEDEPVELGKIEVFIEEIIYAARWVLVPVFLAMVAALAAFSMHFVLMVYDFCADIFAYKKNEMLVMLLTFVDKVLVAGLIVMVMIGGYENSIGRMNISPRKNRLSWLGKVGSGSLKVKLSTSIVSISSIHLLKMFLDTKSHDFHELAWTSGIHFMMVMTSLLLVVMDKIQPSK